ncbi:MAG: hypothetical protein DRN81_06575 [Thermoproteota archaeon]|nr:MAG: hypothetical protein DRN81_06575 [Candidatus Korarchaeota archaeon]
MNKPSRLLTLDSNVFIAALKEDESYNDKAFCTSAYPLCAEYDIYAIDAIYLKVALDNHAALVL